MVKFFPSRTILVSFGNLTVTWYAALIMTGAALAYFISKYNMKKMKYPDDYASDLFTDILVVGILGARLWFCIFYDLGYYVAHPLEIFAIWNGGLAIQGGLVAALIYSYYFAKKRGLSFLRLADAVLPNVLLSQAIGRWGNFVNQECHGVVVDESYYDGILSFIKEGMCINGTYYEPMFFYESVLCIVGFVLIVFILKRHQNKRGDLAYAYLMWYGLIRFFIEGHRTDSLMFGPLKMAQLTSLAFIILGALGYLGLYNRFIKESKPTVLFDLDGTILDTQNGIIKTYHHIFEKYGKEFTKEMETEVLGPSLVSIFTKYFDDKDPNELAEEYRIYNKEIFKSVNKPMDHAIDMLKVLKAEGYHTGVVSTKYHDVVKMNLELYDMNQYIDDIVGADEVKKDKPDAEGINLILKRNKWYRDGLIYVGDSVTDIAAGKNAGAYTVGYYFNPNKKDKLNEASANEYTDDLSDILKTVKKDIYFTENLS